MKVHYYFVIFKENKDNKGKKIEENICNPILILLYVKLLFAI